MAQLLATLPHAEVVDAVDGRHSQEASRIPVHCGDLFQPNYPFPLNPGEIGAFLSHRKCYHRVVESGLDWVLIVEDDLRVDNKIFRQVLDLLDEYMTPDMLVRIPVKAGERPLRVIAQKNDIQLFLPENIGLVMACLAIGARAASNILQKTTQIDRPVDTFLQMHWVTHQPVHVIFPNGCTEISDAIGGSTIHTKKSGNRLSREWHRAIYRYRISCRPQTVSG